MGGLLQQVRLWLPVVWSHRGSSLQQRHSHEPPARQKVRTILRFHNTPPSVSTLLVTTYNGDGLFKHAVVRKTTLKNLLVVWNKHQIEGMAWLVKFEYISLPESEENVNFWAQFHPKSLANVLTDTLTVFMQRQYFQSRIPTDFKCQGNPFVFGSCCSLSICLSEWLRNSVYLLLSISSGPSITMQSWASALFSPLARFLSTLLARWLCSSTFPTTWRRT